MTTPRTRNRRLRHCALTLTASVFLAGGLTACDDPPSTEKANSTAPSAASSAPTKAAPTKAAPKSSLHMLNTNGHKLAFYVTSGRLPAIVLDAGGGLDASYWKKVVPALAAKTGRKIITYDRSGEGKSSYVPGPWRAQNAAADLAAGLKQLGANKNVTLVSHSLAGEIATYFVQKHPRWVAGAVLVDANLPQFFTERETAKLAAMNKKKAAALKKKPSTKKTRQLLAIADGYGPVHQAYHKLSWPTSVPATAIVSAKTPFPTPVDAKLWKKAQKEFADAAPNRSLVVANHSSHEVPIDRPDVVIKAVKDMVHQG